MTADLQAIQPDHLAAGLVVALLALVLGRLRPDLTGDTAALGLAGWLAFDQQLPLLVVPAVALVAVAARVRGIPQVVALAAAGALIALERPQAPAVGLVALAAAALVVTCARAVDDAPPALLAAGLVAAASAATALGGPDTEAAVATGAAAVPVLALGTARWRNGRAQRPIRTAVHSWSLLVLVAVVAADAYRGRPAGLTAGAVAACAAVVAAATGGLGRRRGATGWSITGSLICAGVTAAVAIGAARTIGLEAQITAGAVLTSVAACGLVAGVARLSAPRAPARTPGA